MTLIQKKGKDDEKISVIIPTYNRSHYLKKSINSVLNQKYENIEIIVINDASTDNTQQIIEEFNNNRIIHIKNEKRIGANSSRSIGLRTASGKYIAFLDDDDYYCDDYKLKNQIDLFNKNKNIGFVGSGYYDQLIKKERMPNIKGKIDKKLLTTFSDIETSTIVIKKSVIQKIGFPDNSFPSEQNHDFFYRASKLTEFDFLPSVTVIKGSPSMQISKNAKNKIKGIILFHKKHLNDIIKLGLIKFLYIFIKFTFTISILLISWLLKKPKILPSLYEITQEKSI